LRIRVNCGFSADSADAAYHKRPRGFLRGASTIMRALLT
jgi:hypothetical protein